jgi:hypothetical protein
MNGHVRKYCSLFVAISVIWPLAAWSQTPMADEFAAKQPTGTPVTQLSRDLSQDTQFLTLIRARDKDLAVTSEIRRIISFHDNFRSRLERFLLDVSNESSNREQKTRAITSALARLQKFDDDVRAESELSAKIGLTRKFDDEYPVFRADPILRADTGPIGRALRFPVRDFENDRVTSFIQRERSNANEVFQNVSVENRGWSNNYEKLFTSIERNLGELRTTLPRLDALPLQFNELSGAGSLDTMTAEQIQSGISRYRGALQETLNDLATTTPSSSRASQMRSELLAQADSLGKELAARSLEANTQFQELERSISGAAKNLYGNKVGADSFNYLLVVFAGVFIVIMIMPRFYPEIVATNVLKSEFLLQFSTVFVLVAAIIILAIGELIAKDQLPVLLAGISGYVLGQLGKA